jgi:hypothetical protein
MCTIYLSSGKTTKFVICQPTKVLFSDELKFCTQKSKFITKKQLNNVEQSKCQIWLKYISSTYEKTKYQSLGINVQDQSGANSVQTLIPEKIMG